MCCFCVSIRSCRCAGCMIPLDGTFCRYRDAKTLIAMARSSSTAGACLIDTLRWPRIDISVAAAPASRAAIHGPRTFCRIHIKLRCDSFTGLLSLLEIRPEARSQACSDGCVTSVVHPAKGKRAVYLVRSSQASDVKSYSSLFLGDFVQLGS